MLIGLEQESHRLSVVPNSREVSLHVLVLTRHTYFAFHVLLNVFSGRSVQHSTLEDHLLRVLGPKVIDITGERENKRQFAFAFRTADGVNLIDR